MERERLTGGAKKESRLSRVLGGLAEILATDKFYAPVQEDLNRAPGEPTRAQKLGSDVIVVRVGAKRPDRDMIRRAAAAIRNTRPASSTDIDQAPATQLAVYEDEI